ncbi:MAG: sugar ABC transporter ATP-binding protein [Sphaerochaetaceae bacterium]
MIVETKNLSKRFGNMYALKDINFEVKEGEIHGLVGENGAGKSTLIKILTGVYHKTEGHIFVSGTEVDIKEPVDSRKLGINVIHQDRNLIPAFNGIENIYLGLKSDKKYLCTVDFKKMGKKIKSVMDLYGIKVPLEKMAMELSPPQKTLLEITRAMMTDCKLLILDEPTASLTDKETMVLFDIIRKLNASGTAILYITHRMDEIFELTDRITVFRNGQLVDTVKTKETDKNQLIKLMTDNWKSSGLDSQRKIFGNVVYSVSHIATADKVVKDASFEVHSGEILGIFGLGGCGRTELLEGVYGYKSIINGEVFFKNEKMSHLSPSLSIKKGIVLIHEDRRGHSLVISRSVKANIVLPIIDSYSEKGFYNGKKENKDAVSQIAELKIKTTDVDQKVGELSGGNQQKVVFAKAMISQPEVFLCDEPTQAVDVMTRSEIHDLLRGCADKGKAVVFITSDIQEMLEVADNIIIMSGGKTYEKIENKGISSEQILHYCYQER